MQQEGYLQELTDILTDLYQAKIQENTDNFTSMKRIGEKIPKYSLMEIGGDIKKFESHNKLIAMAGLDPAPYQSG